MNAPPARDDWDVERIRGPAASGLRSWFPSPDLPDGVRLEVAECLPVFAVAATRFHDAGLDGLLSSLTWDGRWHVQIHRDGVAHGYARAVETPAGLRILSCSRDGLAADIDAALDAADRALPDDTHFALLVEVKPMAISVLMLVPHDQGTCWVVVLRVPHRIAFLPRGMLIGAGAFLERMRAVPVVRGVDPV